MTGMSEKSRRTGKVSDGFPRQPGAMADRTTIQTYPPRMSRGSAQCVSYASLLNGHGVTRSSRPTIGRMAGDVLASARASVSIGE